MKIRHGLVLTLALGFGLSACAGGASSAGGGSAPSPVAGGTVLAQGERPRDNEETREAKRALDQASQTEDEAQAQQLYGQALESAKAGIAADSTNPLSWRQAGVASIGLGQYQEANRYLSKAEALRPIYTLETDGIRERAWIDLYNKAIPLVNSGDYEAAAKVFEDANAIYDKRPEARITLGQIYAQMREDDKALENLDRAQEIINSDAIENVDSATAASWKEQGAAIPLTKATVLADAGRFEEAAGIFRQIVQEDPDNVPMARNLAAMLIQMGNTEEAFRVYDNLMTRPDLTAGDLYNIGVGFYQGEAYDKAAEAFGRAAETSVNDRDALEMWTRSLQIDSAYADVPTPGERWIKLDPNNQNAYLILAQAVNQNGDSQRASELVNQIEALKVTVNDLQMTRRDDGARVTGSVLNKNVDPGTQVTLNFTFYDTQGNSVGTATKQVTVSDTDTPVQFEVDFSGGTGKVDGYGYTLQVS
ncbi:MAG: tetratricopeptide repeat protein [Gemmatimonadota bacterium]|jgi:tetratricopeptide (TPR) repeat protein